jgi:hypothetical protein
LPTPGSPVRGGRILGYPTKVQLIRRKRSTQWYIGFPSALAAALGLEKSEIVEWRIQDRGTLILTRKGMNKKERRKTSTPSEPQNVLLKVR